MIAMTVTSSCHWKPLVPFCLRKRRPEKAFLTRKATCSWSFAHSHFSDKNSIAVCADYLIIFSNLWRFFFATFFQKQASKNQLTQGNLLKTKLLNEKQSNLKKEIYGNISLHSKYFSPGTGSSVHKTYF